MWIEGMLVNPRRLAALAFGLGMLWVWGCGGPSRDAYLLNKTLVSSEQKVADAGKEFIGELLPLKLGRPVKIEGVKTAYQRVLDTLEETREQLQYLVVPDSDSARAFVKAFDDYLASQEKLYKTDGAEVIRIASDKKPSEVTWNLVQVVVEKMEAADQEKLR